MNDSLNVHKKVILEYKVLVIKLEKMGVSLSALLNSLLFIVIGIMTFYIAP